MADVSPDQLLASLSDQEKLLLDVLAAGNVVIVGPGFTEAETSLRHMGLVVLGEDYFWHLTARGHAVAAALGSETAR
jgi:hypothetical protein